MAVPDSNGDRGIISVMIRQALLLLLSVSASAAPVGLPVLIKNLRTNLINSMDNTVAIYCRDSFLYNKLGTA
jgi:hypothetical protein